MSLVYAGTCSHAPGITGRANLVDNTERRDEFYGKFDEMRQQIEATNPDALIVVAAEHFANFFMNNMPAFCMGMASLQRVSPAQLTKSPPIWANSSADRLAGALEQA